MSNERGRGVRGTRRTRTSSATGGPGREPAAPAVEALDSGEWITPEEWILFGEEHGLSNRELTIAALICEHLSRKAIARRLRLDRGSVDTYFDRLHKKLGVSSGVGVFGTVVRFVSKMRPSR